MKNQRYLVHNYVGSDGWDYTKHTTGENLAHGFLHPIDYSESIKETYQNLPNQTGATKAIGTAVKVVTSVTTPVLKTAEAVKDKAVAIVEAPFNWLDSIFGSFKWIIIALIVIGIIYGINQLRK